MTNLPPDAPTVRLCHLTKWENFNGYGFNLHTDKVKNIQTLGEIDKGSPAEAAGLMTGDRIVEVNGQNVFNENHRQVVERIKAVPNETRLLVVDPVTDSWYRDRNIVINGSLPSVRVLTSARETASQQQIPQQPLNGAKMSNGGGSAELASDAPAVRLCQLRKWADFDGYGFNLHADKARHTQFVGVVDPLSPAETAGMKRNDKIIEVNGENVESLSHREIVERIKAVPNETTLLVVDDATYKYYRDRSIQISSSMKNVVRLETPSTNPRNNSSDNKKSNTNTLNNNSSSSNNNNKNKSNVSSTNESTNNCTTGTAATSTTNELDSNNQQQPQQKVQQPQNETGMPPLPSTPPPQVDAVDSTSNQFVPRLCLLRKWPDYDGYGFNLHADRTHNLHYIGEVDEGSPAKLGGLQPGDRLVEVNGTNIDNIAHREIIDRIKSNPQQTELLVVCKDTDRLYREKSVVPHGDLPEVRRLATPPREVGFQPGVAAAAPAVHHQLDEHDRHSSKSSSPKMLPSTPSSNRSEELPPPTPSTTVDEFDGTGVNSPSPAMNVEPPAYSEARNGEGRTSAEVAASSSPEPDGVKDEAALHTAASSASAVPATAGQPTTADRTADNNNETSNSSTRYYSEGTDGIPAGNTRTELGGGDVSPIFSMKASDVREMLKQRKKKDPRIQNMDLMQKFKIMEQL